MNDPVAVAAAAIKSRCEFGLRRSFAKKYPEAYNRKLITAMEIDSSLASLLRTQFKLGFMMTKSVPFSSLGNNSVHSAANVELARKATAKHGVAEE
jgi:hypothetical protein